MERTKIYKIIFSLVGFILMLSGVSYAYFITKVSNNETTSTITADAANLEIVFKEGTNQITASDIFPGWYASKTFTVTNKGNTDANYTLYISNIVNPLIYGGISYKIESADGGYNKELSLLPLSEEVIKGGINIQGNTTHTYKITTYYNNLDIDQNADKGKTFSYKIYIKTAETAEYINSYTYAYTGTEKTFTAPLTGYYKLETWGAQGGGDTKYVGGYGGYSSGVVYLTKGESLYVNVGGEGGYCTGARCTVNSSYNGGGACKAYSDSASTCGAGGGATHIATKSGLLSTLENYKSNILIVSGGGGGGNLCNTCCNYASGGMAGGYIGGSAINIGAPHFTNNGGASAIGGTQSSGYKFGLGDGSTSATKVGAGGGYYGGIGVSINGAGGGSGYIGNSLLSDKVMYCYNCSESTDASTKTISTTCASAVPTTNCSKLGAGYAKITYISAFEYNYTGSEQTFTVPYTGTYKIETWGAQGGTYESYIGGYGGYSSGEVSLSKDEIVYINVGGVGGSNYTVTNVGGYNGGGYSGNNSGAKSFGGGGATSIAKTSGTIASIGASNLSKILIIAGGGGGAVTKSTTKGGSGGGYIGSVGSASSSQFNTSTYLPYGGTQTGVGFAYQTTARQGAFGTGHTSNTNGWGGGGGGGLYGGSNGYGTTGAGGSGYIGNSLLSDKVMYCYNCSESADASTKTISTTCISSTPSSNCSKQGSGYARITLISLS